MPFVVCPDILHINTQQLHDACIPARLSVSCRLSFGDEAKDPKLWLFILLGRLRQHAGPYLMCSLCVARCLVVLLRLLFWEPVKTKKSASSAVISKPKSRTKIKTEKSLSEIWQVFHTDEDRRDKVFLRVRVNNSPSGP